MSKISVSRSRDILPDGNQVKRVIQFLSFSILLFISNISLDSKSIRWTETFDEGSSRRKAGFKILSFKIDSYRGHTFE